LECVDYDALGEWITDYAALEATEEGAEAVEATEPPDPDAESGPSRRRPAYLKALASPSPESPESEGEAPDTDVGCEVLSEPDEADESESEVDAQD
jgi:hypothetical protein